MNFPYTLSHSLNQDKIRSYHLMFLITASSNSTDPPSSAEGTKSALILARYPSINLFTINQNWVRGIHLEPLKSLPAPELLPDPALWFEPSRCSFNFNLFRPFCKWKNLFELSSSLQQLLPCSQHHSLSSRGNNLGFEIVWSARTVEIRDQVQKQN